MYTHVTSFVVISRRNMLKYRLKRASNEFKERLKISNAHKMIRHERGVTELHKQTISLGR